MKKSDRKPRAQKQRSPPPTTPSKNEKGKKKKTTLRSRAPSATTSLVCVQNAPSRGGDPTKESFSFFQTFSGGKRSSREEARVFARSEDVREGRALRFVVRRRNDESSERAVCALRAHSLGQSRSRKRERERLVFFSSFFFLEVCTDFECSLPPCLYS